MNDSLEAENPQDGLPSSSRKRARSSGSSGASSSKRALSDEATSSLSPAGSTEGPTPAQKIAQIEELRKKPLVAGEIRYIVPSAWYRRWKKACLGEVDKEGPVEEKDLGPIDCSPITYPNGDLNLTEGREIELLPSDAWMRLISWYGLTGEPVTRKAINQGRKQRTVVELFPPEVRVYELVLTDGPHEDTDPLEITTSTQTPVSKLYAAMSAAVMNPPAGEYRIWRLGCRNDIPGSRFSANKLADNHAHLEITSNNLSALNKTVEEAEIRDSDAFVVEFKTNGAWLVDAEIILTPRALAPSSVSEGGGDVYPLFPVGSDFFSQMGTRPWVQNSEPDPDYKRNKKRSQTGDNSQSLVLSKQKTENKGMPAGLIGLGNMGNTCFMNSALQCLAHTAELTDYFLTGVFKEELNPDNPLGMQGAIAEAFGALLQRMWSSTSSASSFSPREFKIQLQRFAPQFSGYQQHDSQELVAFLLDGLHEDLNRVLKKPYVEKPDWGGGQDLELVRLANESWEGYMKRNDSVIVDLFQGQYQSTLVCPECQKVSITFDPFMYLTLPLPIQKKWKNTIFYVPWDLQQPHVEIPVEINRHASFRELRRLLGRWMNTEPDNLLTLEVFNHRFYKKLDDSVIVGDMSEMDVIVCFQLPCHAQQSRTWKPDPDPDKNPFILAVQLCKDLNQRILLDAEQRRDRRKIYDAIVDRLQRWTIRPRDLYQWEHTDFPADAVEPPSDPLSHKSVEPEGYANDISVAEIEEGDIVDEKSTIMVETAGVRKLGTKDDLFQMHIQSGSDRNWTESGVTRWENWESRESGGDSLLNEGETLFCEWDDNLRNYYFGDRKWDASEWEEFVHPEYTQSQVAFSQKAKKGITLQDCLNEFIKEERLGEDDLWYCPSCKRHQQASKKFDLWKVPDILVVHLKRFSSSRALRDKIDVFVDFPIDGLDIEPLVGERAVAKRLAASGHNSTELGLMDLEESFIYDLYAVDEHLGGLGGGHYRAYAKHQDLDQWYHFDDSYVTPAKATEAVNSNAYLLFYRRRTKRPIGGKTHQIVQLARQNLSEEQLSALPPEPVAAWSSQTISHDWPTPVTHSSPASSLPPLDEGDPPAFEDSQYDEVIQQEPFTHGTERFRLVRSYSQSSSNKAEPDLDGSDEMEGSPQSNIANMDTDVQDKPGWDGDFLST